MPVWETAREPLAHAAHHCLLRNQHEAPLPCPALPSLGPASRSQARKVRLEPQKGRLGFRRESRDRPPPEKCPAPATQPVPALTLSISTCRSGDVGTKQCRLCPEGPPSGVHGSGLQSTESEPGESLHCLAAAAPSPGRGRGEGDSGAGLSTWQKPDPTHSSLGRGLPEGPDIFRLFTSNFFFFVFFFGHTQGMWKFPGQGSDPCPSIDPSPPRELPLIHLWMKSRARRPSGPLASSPAAGSPWPAAGFSALGQQDRLVRMLVLGLGSLWATAGLGSRALGGRGAVHSPPRQRDVLVRDEAPGPGELAPPPVA